MYSGNMENSSSQQDQMIPPPDHLPSASSPKGIVYNHADWGKPINYYINLKNLNSSITLPDQNPTDPVPPQTLVSVLPPAPREIMETLPASSRPQNTFTVEKKNGSRSKNGLFGLFQCYELGEYFGRYFNKWAENNYGADEQTIYYAENYFVFGII